MKDKLITLIKKGWFDRKNNLWVDIKVSLEYFDPGNYWINIFFPQDTIKYRIDEETYKHIEVYLKKRNLDID